VLRIERLRPRSRWADWSYVAGAVAAACLLAILVWPQRGTKKPDPNPTQIQPGKVVAHQPPSVPLDLTPLLGARRDLDEAAMPRFVWPQENLLSASTPLYLLD
jgi:hypothetical protein